MRMLALTTAAILIATIAMARDLRPDLRPKPQAAARLLRTAGDPREHRSAMYLLFNGAEDSAHYGRGIAGSQTTKCV
jgi:hypothetical protein